MSSKFLVTKRHYDANRGKMGSIKFFIQNSVSRLLFVSIILQVQEQLNDNQILDLLSKVSYFFNLSYTKHNLMQPKYTLAGTKVKFQRKMIILIGFVSLIVAYVHGKT